MKKITVLIAFSLFLLPALAHAATLDELNNPMLHKGQWRIDPSVQTTYYRSESRSEDVGISTTYDDYHYFVTDINTGFDYGFTDNLQFDFSNSAAVPYRYKYTTYIEGGGEDTFQKYKAKYNNVSSERITWRPSQAWEFYFNPAQYLMKGQSFDHDYATGLGLESSFRSNLYAYNLGLTWLSCPRPGYRTTNNRADLDGLLSPLLDKRQVKVSLPLSYMFSDYKGRMDAELASGFSWVKYRMRGHNFSITPGLTLGLTDKWQVALAANYAVPGLNYSKYANTIYTDDGAGTVTETFSTQKSRVLSHYMPQLTLTHRPHPQFQWYITGSYDYYKSRTNSLYLAYENGVLDIALESRTRYIDKDISATLGFTWISLPKKTGRALAPDLDGLKRPLLEKRQFRVDFYYTASRQRSWISDAPSTRQEQQDIYTKASYGLLDTFQVYVSSDIYLKGDYNYTSSATSRYKYMDPVESTFGAGLVYRPKQSFELYLDGTFSPWDRAKTEYYDAAGLSATSFSKDLEASVTLGATFLW